MAFLRLVLAYVATVVFMTALCVIAQSLFVLSGLGEVGASISLPEALGMIADDLLGLAPNYAIFIAIGLLIALPAAALTGRLTGLPRALVFAGAGLVCMLIMLTLMKEVFFGVQIIAGARSLAGFWTQAAMGAVAGLAFAALTPAPRKAKSTSTG